MEYRAGPGLSKEWKTNEAQWERERAGWETEHAHWEDKQAKMDNLQENIDSLTHERDAYIAKLDEAQTKLQKSKKSRGNKLEKTRVEMKQMEEDMATLADHACHAEEMCISTQNELRAAKTNLCQMQGQISAYENANHNLKQLPRQTGDPPNRTEKQLRNLEIRCVRAENDRVKVVRDLAEIKDEMEQIRVELEDERDVLAEELALEKAAHTVLASKHKRVVAQLDNLNGEHQLSLDTICQLERIVQARNTKLAQTEESIQLEQIKIQRNDALQAESHLCGQLKDSQKRRDAKSAELAKLRERVKHLVDETTCSQQQVNKLMTESADKGVKIVQLSKARAQDLEDKEGLNVTLQSKQQELELVRSMISRPIQSDKFSLD